MTDNTKGAVVLTPLPPDDAIPTGLREPASLRSRTIARLFAARFDRQLTAGVAPMPCSSLAVHVERLTSGKERRALALMLRQVLRDAQIGRVPPSPRVPLDNQAVAAASAHIDEIRLRLRGPRPVSARGVARLRVLMSDGTGPVYRLGRGDLDAILRQVLVEL
jgi:hypothetical protein